MTVYQEYANGGPEFWTYVDGRRVYLSPIWVANETRRRFVRLVRVGS